MSKMITAFEQFSLGIRSYKKAFTFIFKNGLGIYFIYPLLISLSIFFFSISATEQISNFAKNYLIELIAFESSTAWIMKVLELINYLIGFGIRIVFSVLSLIISSYSTLLVMAPIMAILSERTEGIITGKHFPFKMIQFIKDILRGIFIALRNIVLEIFIIMLTFIFSGIPIIGLSGPVFLLIISFYFYGFSMIDYTSERHQMGVKQSVQFIRKYKSLAVANGMVFSLLLKIPFLGIILAPVLGPVAATLAVLEIKHLTNGELEPMKS